MQFNVFLVISRSDEIYYLILPTFIFFIFAFLLNTLPIKNIYFLKLKSLKSPFINHKIHQIFEFN